MNPINALKQLIAFGKDASEPTGHNGWYVDGDNIIGYSHEKHGDAVIGTMCGDTPEQAGNNSSFVVAAGNFREHAPDFEDAILALRLCRASLSELTVRTVSQDRAYRHASSALEKIGNESPAPKGGV